MVKTKNELKKPTWLKYTKEEVIAIIKKLSEKDITSEKIGLILRDQYGIPSIRLYGIKMKEAMGDKFQEPTTINLENKLQKIINHFKKNKQDKRSERSLVITKSKLKKRTDYMKN
jgi:small subunit ribosomal protein S15